LKDKIRLDKYLFDSSLSESIDKARREIIAGWVKINGETVRESARIISGTETVIVSRPGGIFASRGGEKLEKAFRSFSIELNGKIAADLGASTGGFTDCMLKHGAAKVYSVDVGYGILAHNLRNDPRVIVKERTNVRNLTADDFTDIIDFVTVDLSFISVIKVIDKIKELFSSAKGVMLIKPQFEAETGEQEKGVVREKIHHINILNRVIKVLIKHGLLFKGIDYSPIKGPAGNIEFLLFFGLSSNSDYSEDIDGIIKKSVEEAHHELNA
jgi:23S rRNA (cytidine1920-2'-O)/16S rRNA (cytidine1409-2'-O)-methyltransferase